MTPALVRHELDIIEAKCRAIRDELERGQARAICRAFVETDASRLLKHAARLYAEACRVQPDSMKARCIRGSCEKDAVPGLNYCDVHTQEKLREPKP